MTVDGPEPSRPWARAFVVLAIAVLGSILFAQLLLGEPTAERARPAPAATPAGPDASVRQPAPPIAPSDSVARPTPTALALPSSAGSPSGPETRCAEVPGDPEFGDTLLIDLDNDGDLDAVGPSLRIDSPGGLIEFDVFLARSECDWIPIGRLSEGPIRDEEHNVVTYSWTCSTGLAGIGQDLVQLSTKTFPERVSTVQHLTVEDGQLIRHRPTEIDTDKLASPPRTTACEPNYYSAELAVDVRTCGGPNWTLVVPNGWKTPAAGAYGCAWFSQIDIGLPCQCDAIAPILIQLLDRVPDGFAAVDETVIDGYPTQIAERSYQGMGNGLTTERAYLTHLGSEVLVLRASDAEWSGSWEYLSDALDLFAEAIDIVGIQVPTMEMRHPGFPHLSDRPMYLDPAGNFAWYSMQNVDGRIPLAPCGGEDPLSLARLSLPASEPGNLEFSNVGPVPAGRLLIIRRVDEGLGLLAVECSNNGASTSEFYRFKFEPDGTITSIDDTVRPDDWSTASNLFAASPDGRFSYASGHDPLGRLDYGCTNGSANNPGPAQTLLRYEGTTLTPAFRDVGLTGRVRNMRVTNGGFAIWESHSCQSVGLHVGRVDTDGHIIERHLVHAAGINPPAWTVTATDELIVLRQSYVSVDEFVQRREGSRVEGEASASFPDLFRLDLESSPGWVVTANPAPSISSAVVARSFDGEVTWHLGDNPAASGECAGRTIFAEHPDGYRRVSMYWADIEGDVIDVLTSDVAEFAQGVAEQIRGVVALVACPARYEGYTVWFAHEVPGQDGLRFYPTDLGPIASMTDLRSVAEPSAGAFRLEAHATMPDGTTRTVHIDHG